MTLRYQINMYSNKTHITRKYNLKMFNNNNNVCNIE